jgi:gamma-glutamylcyclotransferase (GGCT)/AIG2-like uncharacterized protein YtfP
MNKTKVAVYGTLKRGFGNHGLINKPCKYAGYTMVDSITGYGFPRMKLGNNFKLYVEVYELDSTELSMVDRLEGYQEGVKPTFYHRKVTTVTNIDTGDTEDVFIYEIVEDIDNDLDGTCTIIDKDIWEWHP